MRLFTRKSKWDRFMDVAAATLASVGVRRLTKITLGVAGGAGAAPGRQCRGFLRPPSG